MSDTSNSGGSPGSSSGRGGGSGSDSSSSGTRETGSQSLFTTTDTAPNAINDVQNTSSASEPLKVVFVLGGPGAGKSTICKHVVGSLNETSSDSRDHYCHLSAGDHLRYLAHVGSGGGCAASGGQCVSEQGHDQEQLPAEAYAGLSPAEMLGTMQRSELMRSDKIVDILCWKLGDIQKQAVSAGEIDNSSSVAFVVDGFPRTLESAELWEDKVRTLFVSSSILMREGVTHSVHRTECAQLQRCFTQLPSQSLQHSSLSK